MYKLVWLLVELVIFNQKMAELCRTYMYL